LAGTPFVVGAKDFSEQDILASMTTQLLAAHGADAKPKRITGSVNTYLQRTEPISDPAGQYTAVQQEDRARNGIAWLKPANFNNTYALADVAKHWLKEQGLL
jgi:osmoprotectant transport system substrate-binding protein